MRSDHWRIEAQYVPEDLDDLAELRRRIIAAGHSPAAANGVVAWLLSKAAGEDDLTAGPTRTRYRKILAGLGDVHDGPRPGRPLEVVAPDGSTRPRRRIPGGHLGAVVAVALGVFVGGGARHAEPAGATKPSAALQNVEGTDDSRRSRRRLAARHRRSVAPGRPRRARAA